MSEHHPRGTESVLKWCEQCCKQTRHAVSHGREGRCLEHDAPAESKRQQRERKKREREYQNPRLFE